MNLNKVFVLGRVTADPMVKSTASGTQVVNFSIATNRVWNDKSGNRKEETEFHNVVVWGKQADIVGRFVKKGALVLVEGRIQTRTWDDKTGQKRKTTEIICEKIQLGPKPAGASSKSSAPVMEEPVEERGIPTIELSDESEEIKEDLPF
jgi:single-strand DNA-binding protein